MFDLNDSAIAIDVLEPLPVNEGVIHKNQRGTREAVSANLIGARQRPLASSILRGRSAGLFTCADVRSPDELPSSSSAELIAQVKSSWSEHIRGDNEGLSGNFGGGKCSA